MFFIYIFVLLYIFVFFFCAAEVIALNWNSDYRFSEEVNQNFFSVFAIFFPSGEFSFAMYLRRSNQNRMMMTYQQFVEYFSDWYSSRSQYIWRSEGSSQIDSKGNTFVIGHFDGCLRRVRVSRRCLSLA